MAHLSSRRLVRADPWLDGGLIALACGVMLVWTWGKWADVFIDWGRELYTPWQITRGRVLYRDLAYLNGPFSPYLNAAWFRLFGVGMRTLVVANIALMGALVTLLYRLLRGVGSRPSATIGCIVFALIFGIGTQRVTGNYNNICPYSHELTHGAVLALALLSVLAGAGRRISTPRTAVAGILLGLLFLTKPETFLAAIGASLVWFLLSGNGARLWLFAIAGAAPVLGAFALLATAMPFPAAARGTLGAWPALLEGVAGRTGFYQGWAGLDFPGRSIGTIARWTFGWSALIVPFVLVARRRSGSMAAVLAAVAPAAVLLLAAGRIDWMNFGRPLPVALVVLGILPATACRKRADRDRAILGVTLTVYALLMLAKLGLYPRIFYYGWALGMPAMMVVIVGLVDWIPSWIRVRGGSAAVARAPIYGLLAVVVGVHLTFIAKPLGEMTYRVGSGVDSLLADRRGTIADRAVEMIHANVGPRQTLAVVPEGVILNYLARRTDPTPYYATTPLEMVVFGEDAMIDAFARTPPGYLAFVQRPTLEYGPAWSYFSGDYGVRLGRWLHERYERVAIVEDPERSDEPFGWIMLLRWKGDGPTSGR